MVKDAQIRGSFGLCLRRHGGRILAAKLDLRIVSRTRSAVPSFPARARARHYNFNWKPFTESDRIEAVVLTNPIPAGAGPLWDQRRHALGESRLLRLLHIALSPHRIRVARGSPANRTKPWPRCRPRRTICRGPNPKPCSSESVAILDGLRAFYTASWPRLLLPVAQHHRGATQLLSRLVQHIARPRPHKRVEREADGPGTVGSVRPASRRLGKPTVPSVGANCTTETSRDPGCHSAFLKERDKEQDARAHCSSNERDKEQNGFSSPLGNKRPSDREPPSWLSPNARNWLQIFARSQR